MGSVWRHSRPLVCLWLFYPFTNVTAIYLFLSVVGWQRTYQKIVTALVDLLIISNCIRYVAWFINYKVILYKRKVAAAPLLYLLWVVNVLILIRTSVLRTRRSISVLVFSWRRSKYSYRNVELSNPRFLRTKTLHGATKTFLWLFISMRASNPINFI